MKRAVSLFSGRHRERGDTIVEVLLALAVLGAVLSASYVISNRSTITNQLAQERLDAVKLAESQFERLKIAAADDPTVFSKTNFCLPKNPTPGNETVPASSAACKVDADDNAAAASVTPRFTIVITNVLSISLPGLPDAGTRYHISITWQNVSGSGVDRLDQYYEVYH